MTYEKLKHDIELLQKIQEKKNAWAYAYECAYMQRGFDLLTHQQKEVIDFLDLIVKCLPYISENYYRFYGLDSGVIDVYVDQHVEVIDR